MNFFGKKKKGEFTPWVAVQKKSQKKAQKIVSFHQKS